jgi:hypothetical protein
MLGGAAYSLAVSVVMGWQPVPRPPALRAPGAAGQITGW